MYSAETSRALPLTAFCLYIVEKHKQAVYKEDCLWLMAASKMDEKNRHLLKRPYQRIKLKPQQPKPRRTMDDELNYIFDGI